MTDTTASPAVRAKQWDDGFFREYVRANRYKRYMGSDENSIIQVNNDLAKKKGDAITFNLVGALDASTGPNTGSTALVGNEKALPNDGWQVKVGVVRDAVVVNMEEEQASAFDIRNAGKVALKELAMRYLKNALTIALGSINGIAYATATAAQRNAWNVANSDRVLYGRELANYNATHSTALGGITAAETLNKATVSLLKRIAQQAVTVNGEGIRPYRYGEDEETYVLFVGTKPFRDLKLDMADVHKDAMERGKENPLFTGTNSLLWDGVVIREIPEIQDTGAVGDSGALVSPVYMCGAQALGVAWAQTTKTTVRKEDDYGFKNGVGFMEMRGIGKIQWGQDEANAIDWSVATGFVAAAQDA